MTIGVGDRLPDATLLRVGAEGPEAVELHAHIAGRKVVIFGLPGAFTGTCTSAHMPSFVRTAEQFREKGVDEIICVSANDPFVLDAWSKATGADAAGIAVLGDATAAFIEAIGLRFDAPQVGMIGRSRRFAMLVEDGIVRVINIEESPGTCEVTAGETLLAAI